MPTVLRVGGLRFFFFSLDRAEPPHVHVPQGDKAAKYWLASAALARSDGFRAHELGEVRALVVAHRNRLMEAWNEYFGRQ